MSIFGFYFVSGLLREAGWPQKQGILRRNVVDTIVLDAAIGQMVDWAAAIGAGQPKLGLQVLAEMFRDRDWTNDDAPTIKKFIEGMRSQNSEWAGSAVIAPRMIIDPAKFIQLGKTIDARKLTDPQMRAALENFCLQGLLWGIANPKAFGIWYNAYVEDENGDRKFARENGLELEEPQELSEFFNESERILRNYERDIGELPEIPGRLLLEARELGREV